MKFDRDTSKVFGVVSLVWNLVRPFCPCPLRMLVMTFLLVSTFLSDLRSPDPSQFRGEANHRLGRAPN